MRRPNSFDVLIEKHAVQVGEALRDGAGIAAACGADVVADFHLEAE